MDPFFAVCCVVFRDWKRGVNFLEMSMPRLRASVGLLPWARTLVARVRSCSVNQVSQNLWVS